MHACLIWGGVHLQLNVYAEVVSHAVENARNGKRKCEPQRRNLKWFFAWLGLVEADWNDQLCTQTNCHISTSGLKPSSISTCKSQFYYAIFSFLCNLSVNTDATMTGQYYWQWSLMACNIHIISTLTLTGLVYWEVHRNDIMSSLYTDLLIELNG